MCQVWKTIHHPKEVKTCGHHCSKSWQRRMRTQRSIVKVMVTTTSRPVSIILEEWAMLSPVLLIISNSCQCVSMGSLGPFSGWRLKKCWLVGGRIWYHIRWLFGWCPSNWPLHPLPLYHPSGHRPPCFSYWKYLIVMTKYTETKKSGLNNVNKTFEEETWPN